jgi:hypothetical protein
MQRCAKQEKYTKIVHVIAEQKWKIYDGQRLFVVLYTISIVVIGKAPVLV